MIEITKLSSRYKVRALGTSDVEEILGVCRENTLFYQFGGASPDKEQILSDMELTPPDTDISDKYFLGFYDKDILTAVMDIVDGYPEKDIAYIGFFMMKKDYQGRQLGTAIINEITEYLKSTGKRAVRLAIDRDNPQSNHFWKKNGFVVIGEAEVNGWTKLVAEKLLVF